MDKTPIRNTRPVTLKEVASVAGVSVNTASRALRDMSDIGKDTKIHVRDIADALGYRKNTAAVRLKTNHSQRIGVIVSDIANPFFGGMVKGIERICRAHGFGVMLANASIDPNEEISCIYDFSDCGVDGILFVPCVREYNDCQRVLDIFERLKLPYLLTAARYDGYETSYVMSDDVLGGYLAAQHLYELGHRKFALLFQNISTSPVRGRIQGFKQLLSEKGLSPDKCIRMSDWDGDFMNTQAAMRSILSGVRDYTALFCYCDYFAMSAYAAIYEAGLRIPEDLSVMGYDNIELCNAMSPSLSTISISHEKLGEVAALKLLEIIRSPYPELEIQHKIVLKPFLVPRNSTAAIRTDTH
ncbi:MAG: LacI family DNA-binding transcriptional regulator [Clostridia bacterium]